MDIKRLKRIKKSMLVGIEIFKHILPIVDTLEDGDINGKYKLKNKKSWLVRR